MIKCDMCKAAVPSIDQAINANWSPNYFIGNDDTGRAVCPKCAETYCKYVDGELTLIDDSNATLPAYLYIDANNKLTLLRRVPNEQELQAVRNDIASLVKLPSNSIADQHTAEEYKSDGKWYPVEEKRYT